MQTLKTSTRLQIPDISARMLHILAMVFMLLHHLWVTVIPSQNWMTCVGSLAFPIFAFLLVEGYFHTHDFKKYIQRLLLFAVISEIPFDLMYGRTVFYPYHQNGLWTFLLALFCIWLMERAKRRMKGWVLIPVMALIIGVGTLLATVGMTSYARVGILMVSVFYFFRGRSWWCMLGQLAGLYWINVHLLGSLYYTVHIFKMEFEVVQQGFALLALPIIWLYQGRQGAHSKCFQYFCYAFYPGHIIFVLLVGKVILPFIILFLYFGTR